MKPVRILFFLAAAAFFLALSAPPKSHAALAGLGPPDPDPVNPNGFPAVAPHGYPGFYEDVNGLQLELCLDGDGINGPCLFDPVTPGNAWSETTGFGAEAFFWLAQANARPLVTGGRALLVLALEAAYGGSGEPVEGEQIVFGRVRVRFDVPGPGHYRVIHPYGTIDLPEAFVNESVAARKDVRLTTDIGAINPLSPLVAFTGALAAFGPESVPFLTWPAFNDPAVNPALQVPVLDGAGQPTGQIIQYVGDGVTPHVVTGSPTGNNVFRIDRFDPASNTWRTVTQTDLFVVQGKVFDPAATTFTAYQYLNPPVQNLFAVGPVNRAAPWPAAGSELANPGTPGDPGDPNAVPPIPPTPAIPAGDGFPIGFPYWYQDTPDDIAAIVAGGGTAADATPGLQLTLCPAFDPMCVSVPPTTPAGQALGVGPESFYWMAVSDLSARTATNRADARVIMAMEAAFGNATGTPVDGDQAVFSRIRIRASVDQPGDYTVTHPYGTITFTNVNTADGINYTEDIGILNPGNPTVDQDFIGALFGRTNPFLTWDSFNPDPLNNDTQLQVNGVQYVGNPLVRHAVTGSPTGDNFFRIQGPGGIDTTETLFTVSGKVFDPATFVILPPTGAPTAVNDAATTNQGQPVVIGVTANDTYPPGDPITSVSIVPGFGPFDGTVTVNGISVTFTPAAGANGIDTFAYTASNIAGASNIATVEVNVLPVEGITVTRAELVLSKRQWNVQGTDTIPGSVLTIHAGPNTNGTVIGSAVVAADGKWQFRTRATTNAFTGVTSISISSSTGNVLLNQPLRVR